MGAFNMSLVTPASDDLISLADAKAHLRVSHLKEDDLIAGYCRAIEDWLDGFNGLLGRALRVQSWRLTLEAIPANGRIRLPLVPFRSITSVITDDLAVNPTTLSASTYRARLDHGFGVLEPAYGQTWPVEVSEVRVTYEVGHESPGNPMPLAIRQAALLQLGALYDNRSAEVEGRIITANPAAERLLNPYIVRSW